VLKEGEPCVHIKAFLKATEGENYVKLVLSKTELKEILTEIYVYGKSLKLRKLLSS
jgi:Uncharacterized metal-binding protein